MPRIIEADALRKAMFSYYPCVNEHSTKWNYCGDALMDYEVADLIEDCIDNAPTIEAVPVEKLGKLGEIMLPYKGCPRGTPGRMGDATLEKEAFYMGVITDEDGGRWVPVNEDVLRELVEKASDMSPHGRWVDNHCTHCGVTPLGEELWEHLDVEPPRFESCFPICPCCGAKMDEEE